MKIDEVRTITYYEGDLFTTELSRIIGEMQGSGMVVEVQFSTSYCSVRGTTYSALIIGKVEGKRYIV